MRLESCLSLNWPMNSTDEAKNMKACVDTFHYEYNEEWSDAFEKLELWIKDNDEQLEATKNGV